MCVRSQGCVCGHMRSKSIPVQRTCGQTKTCLTDTGSLLFAHTDMRSIATLRTAGQSLCANGLTPSDCVDIDGL